MGKKMTVGALRALGIDGKKASWEWEDLQIVKDITHESDRVFVVFEHDGKHWRLEVEHHPEDWSGTNDLVEWPDNHEMTLEEVAPVLREVWESADDVKSRGASNVSVRGVPSGDHECFCLLVEKDDFKRVTGREPDDELDVGPFATEGSPYRYMVYPSALLGLKDSKGKVVEIQAAAREVNVDE